MAPPGSDPALPIGLCSCLLPIPLPSPFPDRLLGFSGELASWAFSAPVSLPISIIAYHYPKSNLQIRMGTGSWHKEKEPLLP